MEKVHFRSRMLKGYIRQHLRSFRGEPAAARNARDPQLSDSGTKALVGTTVRLFDEKALLRWKTHFRSSVTWA